MAIVYCDTGYDTFNIVWSNYNEMNITGLISGIVMLLAPVEEVNIGTKIYKGTVLTGKVIQKTEDGTWKASMHELSLIHI